MCGNDHQTFPSNSRFYTNLSSASPGCSFIFNGSGIDLFVWLCTKANKCEGGWASVLYVASFAPTQPTAANNICHVISLSLHHSSIQHIFHLNCAKDTTVYHHRLFGSTVKEMRRRTRLVTVELSPQEVINTTAKDRSTVALKALSSWVSAVQRIGQRII